MIEIRDRQIFIDGVSTQIRSGSMHYFRIHPDYWEDRLLKLKQCGLNTVETYLAWNFHEKREGVFDFTGWRDFPRFIRMAQRLGLMVIVRPGPYICSEWDFGGLPARLLKDPSLRIRCMNPSWLAEADRYLDNVLPRLASLQWSHGGPILMMQVENEYGSVGNDLPYLQHLCDRYRACGIDVPLFISDWGAPAVMLSGSVGETMLTVNCRNHPESFLDAIRGLRPEEPDFIMELWTGVSHKWDQPGWLTHDPEAVAEDIETLMKRKASFNIYMFHGGTSFGFYPGAVQGSAYQPYVNSYDTDAPLDEAGNPTRKYELIQSVIRRYCPETPAQVPTVRPAEALGPVAFHQSVALFDSLSHLGATFRNPTPEPMEFFDQAFGYILYSCDLSYLAKGICTLTLEQLADRAQIFVDGVCYGVIDCNDPVQTIRVPIGKVDILVENMGRVNAGMGTQKRFGKGLTGVLMDGVRRLYDWTVTTLPLEHLERLDFRPSAPDGAAVGPSFYRGTFQVQKPMDSWLRLPFGRKGNVWLNGFPLGRYWDRGPQYSLYAPAPLFREGENELIVLELHGFRGRPGAEWLDHADRAPSLPLVL